MNGYLLDTSTCIFLLRGKRSVEEKLNEIDEGICYISEIVLAEPAPLFCRQPPQLMHMRTGLRPI